MVVDVCFLPHAAIRITNARRFNVYSVRWLCLKLDDLMHYFIRMCVLLDIETFYIALEDGRSFQCHDHMGGNVTQHFVECARVVMDIFGFICVYDVCVWDCFEEMHIESHRIRFWEAASKVD